MTPKVLLLCDLDRTVIPNGAEPASPQALSLLHAIRPHLKLGYVSGRNRGLIEEAILEYKLPLPDYAVGDVGTTLYELQGTEWQEWQAWADAIGGDWGEHTPQSLAGLLESIPGLRLQEPHKQNRYKLSYYAPADWDKETLLPEVKARLEAEGIRTQRIWSIDEAEEVGLLDILPASATKLHAVRFLMQGKGFSLGQTVFAGDSGNDMAALTSELQAVLVKNARKEVREEALREVKERSSLYLAQGDFLGLNGNYTAGVLEGLAHFLPHTRGWLEAALAVGEA